MFIIGSKDKFKRRFSPQSAQVVRLQQLPDVRQVRLQGNAWKTFTSEESCSTWTRVILLLPLLTFLYELEEDLDEDAVFSGFQRVVVPVGRRPAERNQSQTQGSTGT